jgi:adenylate/nucleoside-diphosphate kinase
MFGTIFKGMNELLIDGNYFDVEEDLVATPLIQLMQDSKKLPEAVLILKIGENNVKEF